MKQALKSRHQPQSRKTTRHESQCCFRKREHWGANDKECPAWDGTAASGVLREKEKVERKKGSGDCWSWVLTGTTVLGLKMEWGVVLATPASWTHQRKNKMMVTNNIKGLRTKVFIAFPPMASYVICSGINSPRELYELMATWWVLLSHWAESEEANSGWPLSH